MLKKTAALGFGIAAIVAGTTSVASAATPAPSGAHPRIWLTPATTSAMKSKLSDPKSAASSVVVGCDHILLPEKANELTQAGIQGYNWAYSSATCALAYRLTGDAKYAAPAVTLFRAMLDDYATLGDGAGGDTVVQHDTGYGIRFFGVYAGLMYDWLHDAPGIDETLRAHARARFKAWTDWYDTSGYLNTTPGSNYHSGYVLAKTIFAVAAGGEDGATSDAYWNDVVTNIFPNQLIKDGLAPKGALAGGDWPEGWQYGTMSVMSYALAARALEEQGVSFPEIRAWADSLTVRYLHGMNPAQDGMYVGGDLDDPRVDASLNPRPLIATMVGPSSDKAASWAAQVKGTVATDSDICPAFDALAEARGVAAADFHASTPPTAYLASGTRNLYARTSWDKSATQAVFTSAPRIVPDHQHFDASNFVLTRGADHLIADPSPYGSRSSLTANAMTVDSRAVESSYAPSQSPWGHAEMPWARATADGVAAARSELGGAFNGDNAPSDVAFARRDWAFLPEGEIVTIDRVRTDDASRSAYLRFRSPATLTMSGNVAQGTIGGSRVAIHGVALSGGTPKVQPITVGECWDSNAYGHCEKGRFAANEYTVTLPGPKAYAVHVIDALNATESAADVTSMNDPSIDTASQNAGILGASITRGTSRTFVLSSSAQSATTSAAMTYGAPGNTASRHVVFDAPEDANGASSVEATAVNGRCVLSITPGGSNAIVGRPLVFTLSSAADGCKMSGSAPAPTGGPTAGNDGNGSNGGDNNGTPGANGGGLSNPSADPAAPNGGTNGGTSAANASADASDGGGCNAAGSHATDAPQALLAIFGITLLLRKKKSEERDVSQG
jgi:hypothetical protein